MWVADSNRRLRFSLTPEHVLFLYVSPPRAHSPRERLRIVLESGTSEETERVIHARQCGFGNLVRPFGVDRQHSVEFGGVGQ